MADPTSGSGSSDSPDTDAALADFRARLRDWLQTHATRKQSGAASAELDHEEEARDIAASRVLQAALYDAGFAGITYPVEYGGQGLSAAFQRAYIEESSVYEMPERYFVLAFGSVSPTVLQLGTEEQKHEVLRKTLRGELTWCQLLSEPGAGSDIAGLQTKAEWDGDAWVLNGQKVWSSGAHRANRGVVLARTDPDVPKHQGLTMFMMDMDAPGVTVVPLRQLTGDAHFSEVFLDDVRIPADRVLGGVGDGWKTSTTLLANERVAIGTVVSSGRRGASDVFASLAELARAHGVHDDPVLRQELAVLYTRERILKFLRQRTQDAVKAGRPPGATASLGKLASSMMTQSAGNLALKIAGAEGQAWDPTGDGAGYWAQYALNTRSNSIGGGTSEIQRNIVGERVLGLPREPDDSRNVPFRDLLVNPTRG